MSFHTRVLTSLRGTPQETRQDCDDGPQKIPETRIRHTTLHLTSHSSYSSLFWLSQERAGKRTRQGNAKGTRQGGKRRGK